MRTTANSTLTRTERIGSFIWQHLLLLISLWIMTFGVALSVRSSTGSSVISSLPMTFSIAGADGFVPGLTIGTYTNLMNLLLVGLQILILRRKFEKVQLFQILAGFAFGILLDFNMYLTGMFPLDSLWCEILAQFAGCTILACGISAEVRCGSVTMPGEGIQVAIATVTRWPFPKVKVVVDTTLVMLAVLGCYCFWGEWKWNIVGPGTLFAMIYVGMMVKIIAPHMHWFDRLLHSFPGFKRVIVGLARKVYPRK